MVVVIDTRLITDWNALHEVFAAAFGFPPWYGRNMNAWIDCMTCLSEPESGLTKVYCQPGEVVSVQLDFAADFVLREPELFQEILDCSAFVNWRRIEKGEPAVLALSYYK